MFRNYLIQRKKDIALSGGGRTPVHLCLHIYSVFSTFLMFVLVWFGPLLAITVCIIKFKFVSLQTAIDNANNLIYVFLFVYFVIFGFTKCGVNLLKHHSARAEATFFLHVNVISTIPPVTLVYFSKIFTSHFPTVPTTPPRIRRA